MSQGNKNHGYGHEQSHNAWPVGSAVSASHYNTKLQESIHDSSIEAIWKMYSVAKASLPYKDRMNNLTWRMLGMRMKFLNDQKNALPSMPSTVSSATSDFDYISHLKQLNEKGSNDDDNFDIDMDSHHLPLPSDQNFYHIEDSINPLNTVLQDKTPASDEQQLHQDHDHHNAHIHYGSFSSQNHNIGFLTESDLHNQFNLFDSATISATSKGLDTMDDQFVNDLSNSSPAIISDTSESNIKNRASLMTSDVLGGQTSGHFFNSTTSSTPTMPTSSNFLDHFFPASTDLSTNNDFGSTTPTPTTTTTPTPTGGTKNPKKPRTANTTISQSRRSSGVRKKPISLRNPAGGSTTSLTSLNNEPSSASTSLPNNGGIIPNSNNNKDLSKDPQASNKDTRCTNCNTRTTPLWRRDPLGNPLCNACGLFLKLHGVVRPLSLKTDVIKKRQRNNNNGSNCLTANGGSKQPSKSSSPNLDDNKSLRKQTISSTNSLISRGKSTTNLRKINSHSPITNVNVNLMSNTNSSSDLSSVTKNLEVTEKLGLTLTDRDEKPNLVGESITNTMNNANVNSNNNTNNHSNANTNNTNNNNNNNFDLFQSTSLSMRSNNPTTTSSSSTSNVSAGTGNSKRLQTSTISTEKSRVKESNSRAPSPQQQQQQQGGSSTWEWLSLSL